MKIYWKSLIVGSSAGLLAAAIVSFYAPTYPIVLALSSLGLALLSIFTKDPSD